MCKLQEVNSCLILIVKECFTVQLQQGDSWILLGKAMTGFLFDFLSKNNALSLAGYARSLKEAAENLNT